MTKTNEPTEMVRIGTLDPQALIRAAVEKDAPIETMERLVALAKDVRNEQAKEAWNRAMAKFQMVCPAIKKTGSAKIQTRGGSGYTYNYAKLGDIMPVITPLLGEVGLHISFRVKSAQGAAIASCRVSHEYGHYEESGDISVPIDQESGMGASVAQRVGIAQTYAKRYALLAMLGISPEDDPDAQGGNSRPAVSQPQRQSTKVEGSMRTSDATPISEQLGTWTGIVKNVIEKKGETNGKEWKLYTIRGMDGSSFGTFDFKVADVAMVAGKNAVSIGWELTAKKNKNALSIERVG